MIIVIKNKKSISIGDRLLNIAEMIDSCEVLLDVGTDHALLPIYLLQEGIISNAIAVDICAGPLEQAKRNAQKYNLLSRIDFIISNGLSNVNRDFDYITIAGLGTNTIVEILENAKNKLNVNCKIVVQSNNSCYLVRKWCVSNGWHVVNEK
ncbi:MAG: class I SAM-dependent methyltransferase, partial [Bacilli bacterium]|nr:class I SAM-dependent methyltransferase [Bacilli bacterium]